jgi:hypothetical protein
VVSISPVKFGNGLKIETGETQFTPAARISIRENFTDLMDMNDKESVVLEKDDAIEVAKLILRQYKVPFANRVKRAGTIASDVDLVPQFD